jgi:hypothetical protein
MVGAQRIFDQVVTVKINPDFRIEEVGVIVSG